MCLVHRICLILLSTPFTMGVLLATKSIAQQELRAEVVAQLGHTQPVVAIALSPDGRQVLSASWDNTVKLWETTNGRLLRTLVGHSYYVQSVAFSPDGRLLVSGSADKTIKIWETATGKLVRSLEGHSDAVNSVVFSPDGRQVLSGSTDKTIRLWETATGRLLRSLEGHSNFVFVVAFSPDGRQVLSGGLDHTIRLWDASNGRHLRTFEGHSDTVKSVAFSPDRRQVLSGSSDKTFRIWDAATGKLVRNINAGHSLSSIAFSPDGRHLLAAGKDLTVWEAATGTMLRTLEQGAHASSATFSRDGDRILSGSFDTTLKLWETGTGTLLNTLKGTSFPVTSVAFSRDGRHILAGNAAMDKSVRLWEASSGRLLRTFEGRHPYPTSVAMSPDGTHVLAGMQYDVLLWDAATARPLRTFEGAADWIYSVAFSPNGKQVVSAGADEKVKLWDVASGRLLRTFEGHSGHIRTVAFSPDGRQVLSGVGPSLKLSETSTGRLLRSFDDDAWDNIFQVAFSPDGRRIISGGDQLRLWDSATGKPILTFDGHPRGVVSSVAFSPDGRLVLSGSSDNTLKLWVAATGKLLRTFDTGYAVRAVAFSPDGRQALSGGEDSMVSLWDVERGQLLIGLTGGTSGWLALTPAGFFDAGGEGGEMLHTVRGLEATAISQVYEYLYRPDLVEHILKGDPEGVYKHAAHRLNLKSILETGPAPQIDHLEERDERAGNTVRISIRVTGRGGGIGNRVVWRVNGVTQGSSTPPPISALASPLASAVVTETLKLVEGQANVIEVTAYNRAGQVATPSFRITIDKFGTSTTARPRMFVLALGVDKYRMQEYRLNYAAHDARSLAKALETVGATLFSEVQAKVLTDEQVTETSIASAIEHMARQARPEDVFVLFLGGHGKSIAGRYYYYPETLDFSARQTIEEHGIGQEKWEAWLAKLTVHKSLLIIDTCEGDAFRGSRGTDSARQTAMAQLLRATGRNIIAASRDAAYEGYQGHGVLTYALLEALDKGTSKGADDRVRVTALADHVGVRVPEISQKSFGLYQTPTRKLTGNDFPIGIRQAVLKPSASGTAIAREPTHVLIRKEILRERPAADAPGNQTLGPGTQVRAVEFVGAWVIVARDGQRLGYIQTDSLARLQ